MKKEPDLFFEKALKTGPRNKAFLVRLKKKPPRDLDKIIHSLHDQVFNDIDCLSCARCCRGLGPRVTDRDIDRMASFLKIKPSAFLQQYLKTDEDRDYIFQQMPCPFLMTDQYCSIYENRPAACREYPHTNRKRMYQLLDICYKNTFVCPAVYEITELLIKHYQHG
jgi:uncharacterized protein